MSFFDKFFRRINLWQGVALLFCQPAKPADNGRVGKVAAIPRQQHIHFVNSSEGYVSGVAVGCGGQKS